MSQTETEQESILEFILNGEAFTARIDDEASLMTVLREQAGLISPKNGCAPQGSCGCCTVIVDGRAVASCAVPAKNLKGKSVLTLEGFTEKERDIFARSFTLTGGIQCGFLSPESLCAQNILLVRIHFPQEMRLRTRLTIIFVAALVS